MSTKKKLLSYNTIKHPLVAQFFDEFEDTHLASHYTREAIAFYQKHKNMQQQKTDQARTIKEQNKKEEDFDEQYFDSILWYLSKHDS